MYIKDKGGLKMGVDINLNIIDTKGEYLHKNFYYGRNTEWFNNLNNMDDILYDEFPTHVGVPENIPTELSDDYNNRKEYEYYGFHHMVVKDFIKWFNKLRPDIDAGWVTTYDKWSYEKKGIIPELYHMMPDDIRIEDLCFIEIEDKYESNHWLYNYIIDNKVPEDSYIVYYFSC